MKFLFIIVVGLLGIWLIKIAKKNNANAQLLTFDREKTLPMRGVLALLIVLHHFFCQMPNGYQPKEFFVYLGATIVAIFFFISGYGLTVQYLIKGKNYFNGFIKKRLLKLIVPLVITIVVYKIVTNNYNFLNTFHGLKNGLTPTPFTWFVYTIIAYYLGFYIIFKHLKLQTALMVMIGFTFLYEYITISQHWDSCWYSATPAINVGMYYAAYENQIKQKLITKPITSFFIISTIVIMFFGYAILNSKLQLSLPFGDFVVFWVIPPIVTIVSYYYKQHNNKILNFLGNISYEIYIVHGIYVLQFSPMKENKILYLAAIYAATIITAFIINKINNKIFQLPKKA